MTLILIIVAIVAYLVIGCISALEWKRDYPDDTNPWLVGLLWGVSVPFLVVAIIIFFLKRIIKNR